MGDDHLLRELQPASYRTNIKINCQKRAPNPNQIKPHAERQPRGERKVRSSSAESMKRTDLDDGEGEELVELEGELVPQLPLVQVSERCVPLRELRPRRALRLQELQRRRHRQPIPRPSPSLSSLLSSRPRRGEELE